MPIDPAAPFPFRVAILDPEKTERFSCGGIVVDKAEMFGVVLKSDGEEMFSCEELNLVYGTQGGRKGSGA